MDRRVKEDDKKQGRRKKEREKERERERERDRERERERERGGGRERDIVNVRPRKLFNFCGVAHDIGDTIMVH